MQVGATFSSEDEPLESNGSAVFSRRYGRFCQPKVRPFTKTGRHFVYKRYYHSKSKSKAVFILTAIVIIIYSMCQNKVSVVVHCSRLKCKNSSNCLVFKQLIIV